MQIHELIQGSDEWAHFRLSHFGASEAGAMLGISSKVKRTELLHMKHTGTAKEFSEWVQKNILDYGHEVEALARPLVEQIIGEDLYPVTCSEGQMSASCDGLTMDEETAFEHKQWNAALAASVASGTLPDEFMPQCQQIMIVTPAKRVYFTVSDGTPENFVYMVVTPDLAWRDRIVAGWTQFAKDLAVYQPHEIQEKPLAAPILALPALVLQIRGEVASSNLAVYKEAAEQFIADIKTDPETDDDFANAEATVKFCEEAEARLEKAGADALSQTADIDELIRTIQYISGQFREKRLSLDKAVKKRKTEIKDEAIAKAKKAYLLHVDNLNIELDPIHIEVVAPDFVAAAKNKRTTASLRDSIDTALANGKIAADSAALGLRGKLEWYRSTAATKEFLFRDIQAVIQKPIDDFKLVVETRIAEHKKADDERLAEEARIAQANAAKSAAAQPEAVNEVRCNPPSNLTRVPAYVASRSTVMPIRSKSIPRPKDAEIVEAVAAFFRTTEPVALEWLRAMDLSKVVEEDRALAF